MAKGHTMGWELYFIITFRYLAAKRANSVLIGARAPVISRVLTGMLRDAVIGSFSGVLLFQRRTFMHRDVVGLVALDFILRIIGTRVMCISLVFDIFRVNLDDLAADVTGLRVSGHAIADFQSASHDGTLSYRGVYNSAFCEVESHCVAIVLSNSTSARRPSRSR